ncbi:hypothetical protein DFH11DRAFT_1053177 [Phellopilus nigrolimitatus]|nr:hypothetical protein DFH11DRAFT_1053177 [Phellopilus nigrolimitatus]
MFTFSRIGTDSAVASSSTPRKGYLAFPAGCSLTPEQTLRTLDEQSKLVLEASKADHASVEAAATQAEQTQASLDQAWQERENRENARRQARMEREREEALIGEKYWVRQGGFLRDADGRRDHKRTEEIRRVVEREDAERRVRERWAAYESGWAKLVSSTEPVTFASIPWPLVDPPKNASDLHNPAGIAAFLFESLSVSGNKTTRKERLRTSLLRWHPDKLGNVLGRVREDDLGVVKDSIDAVVMGLMSLQDAEKAR